MGVLQHFFPSLMEPCKTGFHPWGRLHPLSPAAVYARYLKLTEFLVKKKLGLFVLCIIIA